MTRKDLIAYLKERMPDNLSEIELAKFVYIELGKIKSFDIRYYYGNSDTTDKIYKLAQKEKHNTDSISEKRDIVCITLSYLYKDILAELGINATTMEENNDERHKHVYNIISLQDGRKIRADLQRDLHNIQTKSRTREFGVESDKPYERELSVISDEEMLQIDQNIGYVRDEAEYRDALIEQVRKEIANMEAAEKLEHILRSEKIYDIQRDMGHIERREYYMSVLRKLVGKEMKSKIFLMSCYRKLENGQREYTMCACSDSNGELKPYLFSAKANRFLGVELEDLINMERQGLVIGKTPKEPGVGIVKKYMKTALKKQKALKQQEKIDAIAKQEESGVVAQQAEEDTVAQQAKADTVAKQDKLGEER